MVFADFLNVERVEVLRGPQGTLYGRNSVGGTINIVTRQPTNMLETSVRLTAGNYDKLRAEGAVSGPLIKNKVMGNFAFLRGTREGFVRDLDHPDHSLGSEDTWAGRGQLRSSWGRSSELLLSGDYGRFDGVPLTYAKPIAAKPELHPAFDNPTAYGRYTTSHLTSGAEHPAGRFGEAGRPIERNDDADEPDGLSKIQLSRSSSTPMRPNCDRRPPMCPNVQRQVSQELTLVQRTPKLTWIGGVFFFDEHYEGPVEITVYPAGSQIRPFSKVGVKACGAVRPGDVHPVAPPVADGRRTVYRTSRRISTTPAGCTSSGTASPRHPARSMTTLTTPPTMPGRPRAASSCKRRRTRSFTLSATRGFKSGGLQPFNPTAPEPERAFSPEFAWSYEGGLKRTMAGGRVRVNTAVFYNDYQDLQVQSFLGAGVIDVSNAGISDHQRASKSRRLPRWDGACSSRAMSPGSTRSTIAISHEGRTA